MTWVIFDPVASGPLIVEVKDKDANGKLTVLYDRAIVGCETEEAARQCLYKMFGGGDGWADGRFIVRSGTPEQLEKILRDFNVKVVWDGEKAAVRHDA